MATLRRDGSPRISGIETQFEDGQLYVGMMPRSVKALDLQRDPRLALHSPTDDPPQDDAAGWAGEAKVSGRGVEVAYEDPTIEGAHRFRVEIEEVVLTHLNEAGDRLVVEFWHPGRERDVLERE